MRFLMLLVGEMAPHDRSATVLVRGIIAIFALVSFWWWPSKQTQKMFNTFEPFFAKQRLVCGSGGGVCLGMWGLYVGVCGVSGGEVVALCASSKHSVCKFKTLRV